MRIIAGAKRGHGIAAPKGKDTRPTSDRVRESTFSLIGPVDDATVLDLFAGSGALGLEALSRGARSCTFVESSRDACKVIEANLAKLQLTGARVVCQSVTQALRAESRLYDLILVDPPYAMFATFQPLLAERLPALLSPDGLVVVESDQRDEPDLPLAMRTSRRYGSSRVTLFEQPQ
ncbi:MAG: rRNA (guanine966-N2)-methyltransferase [Gaiellaceae bacterium]|nr:rRNA (guanine966-N2)-methyltransferase [Gaiellaceae bacterium]